MKKSFFTLFLALLVGTLAVSADTKVLTLKKSYTGISVSTGVNVKYTPSSTGKTTIEINGPADQINRIEAVVVDRNLCIRVKADENNNYKYNQTKNVKINVTGPLVSRISASSSATFSTAAWLEFKKSTLILSASSSGNIKMANISAPMVKASVSSSGDIDIKTITSPTVSIKSSSSGDIDINKIDAKTVNASVSSSGDIDVASIVATSVKLTSSSSGDLDANDITASSLTAVASSSGDITINGGSAITASLTSSSGADIKIKNFKCSNKTVKTSSGGSISER